MKKYLVFSMSYVLLCLLILPSCGSDEGDGVVAGGDCSASWKVDGDSYNANDLAFCVFLQSTFQMSSQTAGGDFIMQVNPVTSPGTYMANSNSGETNVTIIITLKDGTLTGSSNARLTFSELNSGGAKGTFSGDFFDQADITSTPKYSVTNGKFEANF